MKGQQYYKKDIKIDFYEVDIVEQIENSFVKHISGLHNQLSLKGTSMSFYSFLNTNRLVLWA
jgi:hypothetical protein